MIALLLAGLGLAAEPPTCAEVGPLDRDTLSVAWVSPAGARVGAGARLTVVPTRDLRSWIADQSADLARMLQGLGLRRPYTEPARAWKVTIFEVPAETLCRPLEDAAEPLVAGVAVCLHGDRGTDGKDSGCGYTVDLAVDGRGIDVFQVAWKDAAARGFCVLPAERFLQGQ